MNEKLKLLGTLSQVYPAWVRAVCRSNVTYDPVELLEEWRKYNIQRLQESPYLDDYSFIQLHLTLMETYTTEQVFEALNKLYKTACPYATNDKPWIRSRKGMCIACPVIHEYLMGVTKRERDIPGGPVVQTPARVKR